ncbi:MAG: prepilin peptidase [Desulfovibrionaceae bacterium]|nr:prepilin peptidase [Desulfovibrionaceae bacterium]
MSLVQEALPLLQALPVWLTALGAFMLGAAMGSFCALCAERSAEGLSVVAPASYCTACGRPLRPWHMVPVISRLVLGGRCAHCRAPFSADSFVLELALGIVFALLWLESAAPFCLQGTGPAADAAGLAPAQAFAAGLACFALYAALVCVLAVAAGIDRYRGLLPDRLVLPAMGLFLAGSALWHGAWGAVSYPTAAGRSATLWEGLPLLFPPAPMEGVLAGLAAAGLLLALRRIWLMRRGVPALGLGDAKLALVMGLAAGIEVFQGLFLAALLALVESRCGRSSEQSAARPSTAALPSLPAAMPFGPHLAAGCVLSVLFPASRFLLPCFQQAFLQ